MPKKTIWLLSAYRSESHAAWADWLTASFTQFNWQRLELPGRHFRWRIRGNPLSWLDRLPDEPPDLILATSMVDLATLKGLHAEIAHTPSMYYFHENQFAYPVSDTQHASIDPQMVQLYGALAANRLIFNSAYNQRSFIEGVDALLKKLPDETPSCLQERLKSKSCVLPVPVTAVLPAQEKSANLILWNHRWEYDKAPELFYAALKHLKSASVPFELALLGDRAASTHEILKKIQSEFAGHIRVNDRVSRSNYEHWLGKSRIVVSTAIHEFQGLAIMEAVSAGAFPVVPDSLCYPEQYPSHCLYETGNAQALADKIIALLNQAETAPEIDAWTDTSLRSRWLQLLTASQS